MYNINNIVVDENRKRLRREKRKFYNFVKFYGKNVINCKINLIWKGSLHEKPESIPLTDELVKEPIMNTREKEHMLLQDEINRREKLHFGCNDDTKCRRFIGRFLWDLFLSVSSVGGQVDGQGHNLQIYLGKYNSILSYIYH